MRMGGIVADNIDYSYEHTFTTGKPKVLANHVPTAFEVLTVGTDLQVRRPDSV